MHPFKFLILFLLLFTVWRLWLPASRRPKGSGLLPPLALGVGVLHFVMVGTDIEMVPAVLLALLTTIGVGIEHLQARRNAPPQEPMPPTTRQIAGRLGSLAVAVVLLGLSSLSAFVWSKSDPLIEGPEMLLPFSVATTVEEIPVLDNAPPVTVVAAHKFLRTPRDLAFNPRQEGQLWVVNGADNSVAIIHDALGTAPSIEYRRDGQASHFMHRPSAIAFGSDHTTIGRPGTFATAQESRDNAIPFMARNFMGPTLFSSDLEVFAHHPGPGLSGSHLDMLHESPLAMGIAWERDHVYWVFGGYLGNIARYDFVADHGIGQHDHTNGIIRHYGRNIVKRVPGVPSHLAVHHPSATLYIADTGNSRILALDMNSGTPGAEGPGWEDGVDTREMEGFIYTEIVAPGTLVQPSGLALWHDRLVVGDHATGMIHVFDLEGVALGAIATGLGAYTLMGLTFGPDELLYFTDSKGNRILRLDPTHLPGMEHSIPATHAAPAQVAPAASETASHTENHTGHH